MDSDEEVEIIDEKSINNTLDMKLEGYYNFERPPLNVRLENKDELIIMGIDVTSTIKTVN
jgi:hypothetical protein